MLSLWLSIQQAALEDLEARREAAQSKKQRAQEDDSSSSSDDDKEPPSRSEGGAHVRSEGYDRDGDDGDYDSHHRWGLSLSPLENDLANTIVTFQASSG